MKKLLRTLSIACFLCLYFDAFSQCTSAGYNQAKLNWDYLDYFPSAGNGTYSNLARSQSQNFAIGTQRVTVTHNFTGSNAPGEDNLSTAETGSYGTGEDVHYLGDGAINYSFSNTAENVKFSVYDIDYNQRITITALNGITPVNVTIAGISGSVLTFAGSGTTTASATAAATTAVDLASTNATINVDIAGPVTQFTITATQTGTKTGGPASGREDGSFWVSDLTACTNGGFTSNYFVVSKPYTNQPGYVLTVRNDSVYFINPANGMAKFLFADYGHTNINSMAYDPVNHFVYYTYSLTGAGGTPNETNKTLRRYDYNMDTLGIVINDITALLPTFDVGVESGAAAFYDGSLYLGVEASSSGPYEAIVWKIDFNSFAPSAASQVYAITGAGHDWADIGVSNGVLYDFDGSATASDLYHVNLMTHAVNNLNPGGGWIPRQTAIGWNDQVYNVGQPNTGTTGTIAPYLYNGSINIGIQQAITFNGASETGSWGDAAEAFKPKVDFGDAPSSFDPSGSDPAVHEISANLRLGALQDIEWVKTPTVNANGDGSDEDGLPLVQILTSSSNYYTDVNVYNNTGAVATVCAWIDFNSNGVFESGEGVSQTVPSSASTQTIQLFWASMGTPLPVNSYTYLRIRVTSAANGMTINNATGYFGNGEVEDFYVIINSNALDVKLTRFNATKINEQKAALAWTMMDEEKGTFYQLERSENGRDWKAIHTLVATEELNSVQYSYLDETPFKPVSLYRLKFTDIRSKTYFSDIQKLQFNSLESYSIYPNPAENSVYLKIQSLNQTIAEVRVFDVSGKLLYADKFAVKTGMNQFSLQGQYLPAGLYHVQLQVDNKTYNEKLFVKK